MTAPVGSAPARAAFAGHRFTIHAEDGFGLNQWDYLLSFLPHTGSAPVCGQVTDIRVRSSHDLFHDRASWLAAAPGQTVTPFRDEPYQRVRLGEVTWWCPAPGSGLRPDHLYAKDGQGRVHIVLRPEAERGERYLMRVIREIVLRCGEHRGWIAFHASATAIAGAGVLIPGPSGAGKTTVLAALAAHARADLIASDRALVTEDAARVVGVPLSVRIAGGTLAALDRGALALPHPGHRLPGGFRAVRKAAFAPRDFAYAAHARVRESAPLALVVLPRLSDDDQPLTVAFPRSGGLLSQLAAACCTPHDEDWLQPWFAERTRSLGDLRRGADAVLGAMAAGVPVMTLTAGVRTPHLMERIADAITGRLP
ncbi:hypothetical protein ACL02R_01425 [Streptomyces sp. MS19]|uniref:hypothetical protein n=1 Tax=Streptomyces sp. MS19 TaxID=3385972 RepID=UPI00399F4194